MKIIEEKLYRYDELSDFAKSTARDQWVRGNSWEYESDAIRELIRVMDEFSRQIGVSYYYNHGGVYVKPGEFVYDLEDVRFRKVKGIDTSLDEMYDLINMWNKHIADLATINDELRAHWRKFEKIEWHKGWNAASEWRAKHPCRFEDERFWDIVGDLFKDIANRADNYAYGIEEYYSSRDFVEEKIADDDTLWFYPDGVMYEAHEAPAA